MKKLYVFLAYMAKNFMTGFVIVLGGIACMFGVTAFQELTTTPSTAGNQSLSTPLLTVSGGVYERDYMSLQAIAEDLGVKKKSKIMFVTSSVHQGNLGGLVGADQICQGLADAVTSTGSVKGKRWMAFLSDGTTSIKTRIPYLHSKIVNPLGQTIFTNSSTMNHFLRPEFGFPTTFNSNGNRTIGININEKGESIANLPVWTGTDINGNLVGGYHCNNWQSNTIGYSGNVGKTNNTSSTRLYSNGDTCDKSFSLYCLEL